MSDRISGQVVWHDLFTSHRPRAMAFYRHVASWHYVVEHATDFAWGGGEKDFVLALSGEEAGAGIAETPPGQQPGWLSYVEVNDIEAIVAQAKGLGGRALREPFEVPGVGRNALLSDPLGARIGVSQSSHSFPAPRRQFGTETYLSIDGEIPMAFYADLFGWRVEDMRAAKPAPAAMNVQASSVTARPLWVPCLKVADPDVALHRAVRLGAEVCPVLRTGTTWPQPVILSDPEGTLVGLPQPRTHRP